MANKSWRDLRDILQEIIGPDGYVYYNPSTSIRLQYDCFIFSRNNTSTSRADNKAYRKTPRWTITYVCRDGRDTDILIDKMLETFKWCTHETCYKANNLEHNVFNLYF